MKKSMGEKMQESSQTSKPNIPLNIVLFIITLVGGPATFYALTVLTFLVTLPMAIISKSIVVRSAAASALAGALVVWAVALVYAYVSG